MLKLVVWFVYPVVMVKRGYPVVMVKRGEAEHEGEPPKWQLAALMRSLSI